MKLKFNNFDDLLDHLEQITLDSHRTQRRWTAAQNFFHLAAAFEGSIKGLPAGYPRLVRALARPVRWVITRYRFPPWIPIPAAIRHALEPPKTADFQTEKARLLKAIKEFRDYKNPHPPHPVLGTLSHDEWTGFHLRHCERHLSFIAIGQGA